jgi:hypothetical protein
MFKDIVTLGTFGQKQCEAWGKKLWRRAFVNIDDICLIIWREYEGPRDEMAKWISWMFLETIEATTWRYVTKYTPSSEYPG